MIHVKITDDSIGIYKDKKMRDEDEIVYWHQDEWIECPDIVPSIANSIKLAYTKPTALLKLLGK